MMPAFRNDVLELKYHLPSLLLGGVKELGKYLMITDLEGSKSTAKK